jgi:GT2 family glycosyltransferase
MKWAELCFSSLRKSTVQNDVFVVDNGSTDGTQDYIKQHYPEFIFTQSESNLGFGKANNLGFEYALKNDYKYVYLLNQDAWVMEDTFEKLIAVQSNHPEYGVISPMQMQANLRYIDTNFYKFSCADECSKTLLSDLYTGALKDVYEVPFVMAAHWLISINNLKKIGGFSPTFPHYGEDDNFINRTIFHNFKVGIVTSAKAVHDREDRKLSDEKMMYISYISYLKQLSNPFLRTQLMMVRFLYNSVKNVLVYRSFKPLIYFTKIIGSYKDIKNNRRDSIEKECPFLG